MSNSSLRHLVPVAFLEAIRPDLLLQLLSAHGSALSSFGLALRNEPIPKAWFLRFHEALALEVAPIPMSLLLILIDVLDLAYEGGRRLLLHQAFRSGLDLSAESAQLDAQNFALQMYLHHPHVFRLAHAQFLSQSALWSVEYRASHANAGLPLLAVIQTRAAELIGKPGSPIRRIQIEELRAECVFRFAMAGRLEREDNPWMAEPWQAEVATYDKRSGRLSVRTREPDAPELVRTMMGLLMAERADHFRELQLYDAAPLKELGARALDAYDISAIERIRLRHITYTEETGCRHKVEESDLSSQLDTLLRIGVLRRSTIDAWEFGLSLRHCPRVLGVEIRPPNRLRIEPHVSLTPLQEFLTARGFAIPRAAV